VSLAACGAGRAARDTPGRRENGIEGRLGSGHFWAMRWWLAVTCFSLTVRAAELVLVPNSVSPDRRLAVAVVPQKAGADLSGADTSVFLVEPASQRAIGLIPEVDAGGGSYGKTTENVRCAWSPDGRHLAINFRTGRLNLNAVLFRVEGEKLTRIPLPTAAGHPKSRILEALKPGPNAGMHLSWEPTGDLVQYRWGFLPRDDYWMEDFAKYGLSTRSEPPTGLEFVFRFGEQGKLGLIEVRSAAHDQK
jgi:hypothetical protein